MITKFQRVCRKGLQPRKTTRIFAGIVSILFLLNHATTSPHSDSHSEKDMARPASTRYEQRTPSRDGIGKIYMGREISQVMGHLAAGWLERPEREREEMPNTLIKLLKLKEGDVVTDIGVGTGYIARRISP